MSLTMVLALALIGYGLHIRSKIESPETMFKEMLSKKRPPGFPDPVREDVMPTLTAHVDTQKIHSNLAFIFGAIFFLSAVIM